MPRRAAKAHRWRRRLFNGIPGIQALSIREHSLFITRDPTYTWEEIVDDVRDALRDFFL